MVLVGDNSVKDCPIKRHWVKSRGYAKRTIICSNCMYKGTNQCKEVRRK